MKHTTPKHLISSESYHWLWYVDDDILRLPRPFFTRFKSNRRDNILTTHDWINLFIDEDRVYVKDQLNRFKHGNGKTPLTFSGLIKEATGGTAHARFNGQALEFEDGKPSLVSGSIDVTPGKELPNTPAIDDSYLLDLIMKRFPYSIFFKDRQSRFLKISNVCAAKFGLNHPDEAIGKTDFDFFDDSHANAAFQDEQKIIETGAPIIGKLEKEVTSGSNPITLWASSTKLPLYDSENNIIGTFGITKDVTDKLQAEDALKETHNFFDQILNNTSEGIYVINSNFEYIYWNSMMETISGMSSESVLGKKPFEIFPHVNHEKLTYKLQKAMSGKTVKSSDYYYDIESSGNKGWAHAFYTPLRNDNGEIDNVLVAISDISERKQAEEKLRKSDETLTKLSQQVPGAIYQFQQYPDGSTRFPFASEAIKYIYELTPEEVFHDSGKAIQRIHPEDLDSVVESINKSFNTLEPWELDYRVQLPKRGLRWLRGRARPEKQDDGSVIWHGYLTDITHKKQQENDLNETLDIVSEQNSRLLNFAHIVSHNLRNHAGNISALLSLIESETSEAEKAQLFNYLNMASTRLNETIKDLNDIIDQQSGSTKNIISVNVCDFINKIREILSTEIITHNVTFDVDISNNSTIEYNPAYLESILLNLISNAIKYRHPERDPIIGISFEDTVDGPLLTISDNGQGVDLNRHGESLFGMYKTFHDNEDSKGIGLYITKNQVESMGGTISVDSSVGKGTTFKILLACDICRIEQATQ